MINCDCQQLELANYQKSKNTASHSRKGYQVHANPQDKLYWQKQWLGVEEVEGLHCKHLKAFLNVTTNAMKDFN